MKTSRIRRGLYSSPPQATRARGAAIVRDGTVSYHLTIRDLPSGIRPRERLQALGPEALSDEELIAIILRTGTQAHNVLDVARDLLARHGNLDGVGRTSRLELERTRGIGPVKALDLMAAFELGRRLAMWAPEEKPEITGPEGVYNLLRARMSRLEREEVRVILLNTKNRVQNVVELSAGSLNSSIVRPAEVFREAIRQQAAALVLVHNHPSGDPTPSAEDVSVTRKIVSVGTELDIEVLDHIIIGQPSSTGPAWVSLRERGLGFGRS
jgi:DNA repair protein RadC